MGGNAFCFKACDPAGAHPADYCQHIYDRIGCSYNAPNNAQNNSFTSCKGDNQDYPGIYTDSSGTVQTYTQPPESLGAISTMPYQPRVPASSQCVTYSSAALYAAAATDTVFPSTTGLSGSSKPSGSSTGSNSPAKPTAAGDGTSDASTLVVSSLTTLLGVAFSVAFLA
jgi:hypothetical protein